MNLLDQRRLNVVGVLATSRTSVVYHATCSDPALPPDVVFKLPRADLDPGTAQRLLAGMRKAVELLDVLPSADSAELDSLTTWPLAMVLSGGRVVGCVMRLVGREYYLQARPQGGQEHPRLFELQLLCASADHLKALGINRSAADDGLVRLALMARLAYILEVIHRPRHQLRLVYGDLNLSNVVLATRPPRVRLMGCDAVAAEYDLSRMQLNTPTFVPPEMHDLRQRLQDQLTDVYKLGLCVIRGLAAGRGATRVTDPASPLIPDGLLDANGIELLSRAVGARRDLRPSAEQIKDYLIGRVLRLAGGTLVRSS